MFRGNQDQEVYRWSTRWFTIGKARCLKKHCALELTDMQSFSYDTQRVLRGLALTACLGFFIAIANSATHPSPVYATSGDGITAYISPPFVQGPPSNTNSIIEDFDSSSFCSTLGSRPVGTFSGACTSVTSANGDFKFGGANTTSDQPTVGGTASTFAAAWNSQVLTLSFAANSEARYIGFWWSAGSAGNQVRLYSKVNGSDVLTATFTTNNLNDFLNTSGQVENSVLPPNPYPGTQMVTALDGSQYKKGYYFGRPSNHPSLTPTVMPFTNVNDNIYSHAYLNVYASGGVSFSKVEFVGGGFELDNVAVSDQIRTPTAELVLLQSVLGKSVEFRANGGTGFMPAQTGSTASNLSANVFTRTGHTFAGWSTTPTGTVNYIDNATYAFGSDLILHAIWTANSATTTSSSTTSTIVATGTAPSTTINTVATPTTTAPTSGLDATELDSAPTSLPNTGQSMSIAMFATWLLVVGVLLRRHHRLIR
jgi:uncharacterized repeat protein (TIGR02543 family)